MELAEKILHLVKEHTNNEIALIGYRGSKHFNLEDSNSDVDLQVYTIPTIKELLLSYNNKPLHVIDKDFDIHIDPMSVLAKNAGKFSLPTIEALTLPVYVDDRFEQYRLKLLDLYKTDCGNIILSKNLFFTISYYVKSINDNASLAKAYKFKLLSEYFTHGYIADLFINNDIGQNNREYYFKIRNGELSKSEMSKLRNDIQKLNEKSSISKVLSRYSKLLGSLNDNYIEREFQDLLVGYLLEKLKS